MNKFFLYCGSIGAILLSSCAEYANTSQNGAAELPTETRIQTVRGAVQKTADTFTDCVGCPEMVIIPGGEFMMGSSREDLDFDVDETPQHKVVIQYGFAVGKYEVSRGEFRKFVEDTGHTIGKDCYADFDDDGILTQYPDANWKNTHFAQNDDHPVVCISWGEAKAYIDWLSNKTGHTYRLLSEAEFEYVNRAGSKSIYAWGDDKDLGCAHANGVGVLAAAKYPHWLTAQCDDKHLFTSPRGAYPANAFGLYDTTGNVMEWVEDWFKAGYAHSKADGSAYTECEDCTGRVIRSGSWSFKQQYLRTANRGTYTPESRSTNIGFRVARNISSGEFQ